MNMLFQLIRIHPGLQIPPLHFLGPNTNLDSYTITVLYLFTGIAYMYNHQHVPCVLLTYIDSNLDSSQTEGTQIQTCCGNITLKF